LTSARPSNGAFTKRREHGDERRQRQQRSPILDREQVWPHVHLCLGPRRASAEWSPTSRRSAVAACGPPGPWYRWAPGLPPRSRHAFRRRPPRQGLASPPPPPASVALRLRETARGGARGTPPLSSVIEPPSAVRRRQFPAQAPEAFRPRGAVRTRVGYGRVGLSAFGRVVVTLDGETQRLAALATSASGDVRNFGHGLRLLSRLEGSGDAAVLADVARSGTAMKMTMTNGSNNTCSTYQRSSVSPR